MKENFYNQYDHPDKYMFYMESDAVNTGIVGIGFVYASSLEEAWSLLYEIPAWEDLQADGVTADHLHVIKISENLRY